jgi:Fic family protein
MTYGPRITITTAIAAGLVKIERVRGFLEAARLSPRWLADMRERAIFVEAYHTTRIEGTQLTVEQAERVYAGETVAEADTSDARELLNYREAFDLVAPHVADGARIDESLVLEANRRLLRGTRGDSYPSGHYRDCAVRVADAQGRTVHSPPGPERVPDLMSEFLAWLDAPTELAPVLVAGIAQHRLVDIHPFVDGNGRTARLISMLCLYRAGYDFRGLFNLSEHYDADRAAYYAAIQRVRESRGDLTTWLEYFVEGLAGQTRRVRAVGEQVIRADLLARERSLNERQQAAVAWLIDGGALRLADYEALAPGVDRRTLQRDLRELVAKGIVAAEGATNRRAYRLLGEELSPPQPPDA